MFWFKCVFGSGTLYTPVCPSVQAYMKIDLCYCIVTDESNENVQAGYEQQYQNSTNYLEIMKRISTKCIRIYIMVSVYL